MRELHLTKHPEQNEGYRDYCKYVLEANSYKGPALLKMMDLRDKILEIDHNMTLELEETEWAMLKQLANQTDWMGGAADKIGPFLKDIENAPTT